MIYYFKQRLPILIGVFLLFLMGIAFGSIAVRTLSGSQVADLNNYLQDFYFSFSNQLNNTNRHALALRSLVDNIFKVSGLVWILGLTIIGVPLILVIVFVRGFVLGFTVGFMISDLHFSGILVAMASLLPHNLLIVPALLLAATTGISFAVAATKTLVGRSQGSIVNQFLATTVIILCCSGVLALATLIEMYITPVLMRLSFGLIL